MLVVPQGLDAGCARTWSSHILPSRPSPPPHQGQATYKLDNSSGGCGSLNNALPKNVHNLIPRPHDYVTLHDQKKKEIADVIKLIVLIWEDYPGLLQGPCKREAG